MFRALAQREMWARRGCKLGKPYLLLRDGKLVWQDFKLLFKREGIWYRYYVTNRMLTTNQESHVGLKRQSERLNWFKKQRAKKNPSNIFNQWAGGEDLTPFINRPVTKEFLVRIISDT